MVEKIRARSNEIREKLIVSKSKAPQEDGMLGNRREVVTRREPDMVTIRISEIYRQVPGFGNCEREGWLRAVRRQLVTRVEWGRR